LFAWPLFPTSAIERLRSLTKFQPRYSLLPRLILLLGWTQPRSRWSSRFQWAFLRAHLNLRIRTGGRSGREDRSSGFFVLFETISTSTGVYQWAKHFSLSRRLAAFGRSSAFAVRCSP
jgi:hypothetical protein